MLTKVVGVKLLNAEFAFTAVPLSESRCHTLLS